MGSEFGYIKEDPNLPIYIAFKMFSTLLVFIFVLAGAHANHKTFSLPMKRVENKDGDIQLAAKYGKFGRYGPMNKLGIHSMDVTVRGF